MDNIAYHPFRLKEVSPLQERGDGFGEPIGINDPSQWSSSTRWPTKGSALRKMSLGRGLRRGPVS